VFGDVAQLGERSVRNAEAVGSNPIISTKKNTQSAAGFARGFLFL
jgi:hypothetical protein